MQIDYCVTTYFFLSNSNVLKHFLIILVIICEFLTESIAYCTLKISGKTPVQKIMSIICDFLILFLYVIIIFEII